MVAKSDMATPPAYEDVMTRKFPAALLATIAVVAVGFSTAPVSAQTPAKPKPVKQAPAQRQFDAQGRPYYGSNGPNTSYMQGPHTRVYITTRSWLDAGVEVLPGDRKFSDYAFPSQYGYPDFARENNNRPIDRQPTNPPSDGGFPTRFPLY
jgi:hypothetical protein